MQASDQLLRHPPDVARKSLVVFTGVRTTAQTELPRHLSAKAERPPVTTAIAPAIASCQHRAANFMPRNTGIINQRGIEVRTTHSPTRSTLLTLLLYRRQVQDISKSPDFLLSWLMPSFIALSLHYAEGFKGLYRAHAVTDGFAHFTFSCHFPGARVITSFSTTTRE